MRSSVGRPAMPLQRSPCDRLLNYARDLINESEAMACPPDERIARRELYRSCSRLGKTVVDIAERVVYAVMKQS